MSTKARLLELFGLPQDETIFEDFGCALVDTIMRHGRMFVAENNICFYANIFGRQTKKVIKVSDITNIEKKKMLGILQNSIEITTQHTSFYFSSFNKRDAAFGILYSVWKGEPYEGEQVEEEEKMEGGEEINVEQADVEVLNLDQNANSEEYECLKVILPISVDAFFQYFLADDAAYSIVDGLKNRGATGIQCGNWSQNDELEGFSREVNCVIKVQGVPFRNTSRFYKVQKYQRDGEKITMRSMCKTYDVPYGSNFQVEEKWDIQPIEQNKCKITMTCWTIILKKFVMQGVVQTKASEGIREDCQNWLKEARRIIQKSSGQKEGGSKNKEQYEQSQIMDKTQLQEFMVEEKDRENSVLQKRQPSQKNSGNNQSSGDISNQNMAQLNRMLGIIIFMILILILIMFLNFFYLEKKERILLQKLEEIQKNVQNINKLDI